MPGRRVARMGLVQRSLLFLLPLVAAALLSGLLLRALSTQAEEELLALQRSYLRLAYTKSFAVRWVGATKEWRERLLGDERDVDEEDAESRLRMRGALAELARVDPEGEELRALLRGLAGDSAETADRIFALADAGAIEEAHAVLERHEAHWRRPLQAAMDESERSFGRELVRLETLAAFAPVRVTGIVDPALEETPEMQEGIDVLRFVYRLLQEHSAYAEAVLSGSPAARASLDELARRSDEALRDWTRIARRVGTQSELIASMPERMRSMRTAADEALTAAARGRRKAAFEILEERLDVVFDRDIVWEPLVDSAWAEAQHGLDTVERSAARLHALGLGLLVVILLLAGGPVYSLYTVVRPVGRLRDAVRRYGAGELEARASEEGPPEIAALAHAFNDMALLVETRSRELEHAYRAAEEGSRVKGRFLAQMSHEIRTPMNGILGTTELLLRSELAPEARSLAEKAHRSGKLLLELLNDILDFSKLDAGRVELESIELEPELLLRGVAELLEQRAQEKGIEIHVSAADALPRRVVGDPSRLRQTLLNLVGNAVRFTDRGRIDVRASWDPKGGAGSMRVEVRDTGIGIDPAARAQLFQPFMQAEAAISRRYGGSGLGLAICKQLVELMGGEIGVESQPGVGSRFWFSVPVELPAAGAAPQEPAPAKRAAVSSRSLPSAASILLVEDNPVNREVAEAMLKSFGCSVDLAENGIEARDRCAAGRYDVVLMDCQMPVEDGYAAARAIRALEAKRAEAGECSARVPIVAVTAAVAGGERSLCLEAGMDDVLAKPFTMDDLQQTLLRLLPDLPRDESLDESKLEAIRRLEAGGASGLLDRTLTAYLGSAPRLLASVREAVAEEDSGALIRAAHSLKSSSRNVGAVGLGALAETLERAGREGSSKGLDDVVSELELSWERVRPRIAALIGGKRD